MSNIRLIIVIFLLCLMPTRSLSEISVGTPKISVDVNSSGAIDRLTEVSSDGSNVMDMTYADNGNILSKTGVGSYIYDPSVKPHAVTSVSNVGNTIGSDRITTDYGPNGKIGMICNSSGSFRSYSYGPDDERWMVVSGDPGQRAEYDVEHVYFGDYERIIEDDVITEYYFLDNDIILINENYGEDSDTDPYLYACQAVTDNLGNILTVYDDNRDEVFCAKYDAWGKQTVFLNNIGLRYGYTGHEMLPQYGLIDMVGRLYDPDLGRFLSCDNYVQEPTNSQNFNRYSYCLNNPLRYTDPTGQLFGIDDAVLAFAAFNMASSLMQAHASGENMWTAAGRSILGSAASFGFSSAINAIGGAFGHSVSSVGNELMRAGAHGVASGTFSAIQGNSFGTGFATGAVSSFVGSGVQLVGGSELGVLGSMTLTGGVTSMAFGGNFFSGAQIGLQIGAMNHTWQEGGINYNDDSGIIEGGIPSVDIVGKQPYLGNKLISIVSWLVTEADEFDKNIRLGTNGNVYFKTFSGNFCRGGRTKFGSFKTYPIKNIPHPKTIGYILSTLVEVPSVMYAANRYGLNSRECNRAMFVAVGRISGGQLGAKIGHTIGASIVGGITGGASAGLLGGFGVVGGGIAGNIGGGWLGSEIGGWVTGAFFDLKY